MFPFITNIISKKTTKFPLKRNKKKKIITSNDNTLLKDNSLLINRNNSNGIMINKKTGTKIKNNNNIFIYNVINNYNNKQKTTKKQILKSNKISLNDQELNSLKYSDALIKDKRTYFQYYISLLKKKHLILFAIIPINDYNLQYIKIALLLLSFSLYFTINGFFF